MAISFDKSFPADMTWEQLRVGHLISFQLRSSTPNDDGRNSGGYYASFDFRYGGKSNEALILSLPESPSGHLILIDPSYGGTRDIDLWTIGMRISSIRIPTVEELLLCRNDLLKVLISFPAILEKLRG